VNNPSEIPNVAFGLGLIATYDDKASVNHLDDCVQVIVDECKSAFTARDEDKLRELGWYHEDREVWLYYYEGNDFDD
jgi:hypothetical protein